MSQQPAKVPGTQSARRALEMLFYFDARHPDATVEDLARAVDLPLPTAYRYVALLRQMSIIEEGPGGTYHLTPRVLVLGEAVGSGRGLISLARPYLQRLSLESGETALLTRLIDHAAVCVDRAESTQPMRITYQPGQAVSLQQGASARVLIAGLSVSARAAHLDVVERQNPSFAGQRRQFETEIDRADRQGWAISHGEIDAGIVAVAAPVRVRGITLAALSIAGPAFRVAAGALDERREAVATAAQQLAEALDGESSPRSETDPGGRTA